MLRSAILLFLGTLLHSHAIGFANGVKIGELTDTSVILWTRLTQEMEAGNQVDEWKADAPNWTVPGAEGEVRFLYHKDVKVAGTNWSKVDAGSDFCHQVKIENLDPDTLYNYEVQGMAKGGNGATQNGFFRTAPTPESSKPVTFTVSTCQRWPYGFLYRSQFSFISRRCAPLNGLFVGRPAVAGMIVLALCSRPDQT